MLREIINVSFSGIWDFLRRNTLLHIAALKLTMAFGMEKRITGITPLRKMSGGQICGIT